jgi:heterodisulfide reductase subunit B
MRIGFYPGCSLTGSSREYNESVKAIAKAFNITFTTIPDWNCCGATAAHNLDKMLSLSLPARIIALAEKEGLTEVVVPCAACYNRLESTRSHLAENPTLRSQVAANLDIEYHGNVKILNVIQFIEKYITQDIHYKIQRNFYQKVACYYGCLLVRPSKVLGFDREEDPQSMDKVMKLLGAESIDWAFKTECCGAGFSISKTQTVARLSGNILEDAVLRGAEAVIVACPMCHSNLDMRRPEINNALKEKTNIPVMYITQAIGLAIGIDEHTLGLHRHFVQVNTKTVNIADRAHVMVEPTSEEN